jgi:Holliday junction resolvase RusA-like endonuclease
VTPETILDVYYDELDQYSSLKEKTDHKIILLWQPISTNSLYRAHWSIVYMTKKGKDLKKSYIKQATEQYKGDPLTQSLEISIDIYFWTKRKSDRDNYHKLSMDSLEWILYENDNQIQKATVTKRYDKHNPRIEIYITDRHEKDPT